MTARSADTVSPQTWRRLQARLEDAAVDWERVVEHLESGGTGKLEIDFKDGHAFNARMLLSLGRKPC